MVPQGFTALGEINITHTHTHLVSSFAGDMYSNGYGVEQDQQEAIRCYKRAAELGLLLYSIMAALYVICSGLQVNHLLILH